MDVHERRALPEGWEWKKLGDVAAIMDVDHKMPKGEENGVFFISPKDLIDSDGINFKLAKRISEEDFQRLSRKCKPEIGDIIYSRIGTIGKVRKVPLNMKFQISYSLCLIRPISSLKHNDILYWLLKSPHILEQALMKTRGIGVPDLGLGDIKNFLIPIPPLPTQRRIVSILEKAEETKRLRAQADELTKRLLQSVFLEMFGDPVKNPKWWERRKLSAVSHINMGQSPPGESYNKNGMGTPLLNGPTEFGDIHPTTAQWTDKPTKICNNGDILFCVRGATAGRMNWADQRYCIGRGIAAIQSIPNLSDNRYLYQILLMNYERFQATGKGSTFINISSSELGSLIVPVPPIPLQQEFARVVEKVESMRQSQNQSKQQIENLFSALMQKAFRGEI